MKPFLFTSITALLFIGALLTIYVITLGGVL